MQEEHFAFLFVIISLPCVEVFKDITKLCICAFVYIYSSKRVLEIFLGSPITKDNQCFSFGKCCVDKMPNNKNDWNVNGGNRACSSNVG